ncbi:TnpA family transposase [Nocardia sp. GAS34]
MIDDGVPGYGRFGVLSRVELERFFYLDDQSYIRFDTLAAANTALIEAEARIPLAQAWGGGLVASVDGVRFVVPVPSIHARPNPKYFGHPTYLTEGRHDLARRIFHGCKGEMTRTYYEGMEDRFSPFVRSHIGIDGHYSFYLPDLGGTHRLLRDPDAPADE